MREILISFAVCLSCLMIAVISQIISPTQVTALQIEQPIQADVRQSTKTNETVSNLFELDPEDSNPSLFTMASDKTSSSNSPLGAAEIGESQVTSSGLKITELVIGDGQEATPGTNVSVNYRGTLDDGKEFDSSYGRGPFEFSLGAGMVIKGWDEGVAGMKVGGKRKLVIPPELGYGSRGIGPIPRLPYPNSGGMTNFLLPPTFIPATPSSQPFITIPAPKENSKGPLP